jgi:predicted O-methyltransferase YrrM
MDKEKIVLVNSLSPADILVMSAAIRSLHKAYPNKYLVDVRSPCNEIFLNSPYITPIHQEKKEDEKQEREIISMLKSDLDHPPIPYNGIKYIIAHYPEIHRSGMTGLHFSDGHRMFLEKQLDVAIPRTGLKPDIFLSDHEKSCDNALVKTYGKDCLKHCNNNFWLLNAGIKNDYTLKYSAHHQEVVDLLKGKVQFVQVGLLQHDHPPLKDVIDMRGKTNLRELFRLTHDAKGAISCVSLLMHASAALSKPCVVIAAAREGVRWEFYPDHQYLYRNGVMKCAPDDGCWKSKIEDCNNKHESGQPMCMELISPEEVARAVELYYLGGRIETKVVRKEQIKPPEQLKDSIKNDKKIDENNEDLTKNRQKPIIFDLNDQKTVINSVIFNNLRILKKINPEDTYYEAYKWHFEKRGLDFMDAYHFMWWLGANIAPKRILEIGSRTGVSLCQLLSAYTSYKGIDRIVCCDNFSEIGSPEIIKANLSYLNIPDGIISKVEFLTGSSLEEIPKLDEKFDYILVDGCHDKDYARQDLINSEKLIDVGGYITMDDLAPDGCSLQDIWDEFKYNHKNGFEFYENHEGKGLGVAKRIKEELC